MKLTIPSGLFLLLAVVLVTGVEISPEKKQCNKERKRLMISVKKKIDVCLTKVSTTSGDENSIRGCIAKCVLQMENALDEKDNLTEESFRQSFGSRVTGKAQNIIMQTFSKCMKKHGEEIKPNDELCSGYEDLGLCVESGLYVLCDTIDEQSTVKNIASDSSATSSEQAPQKLSAINEEKQESSINADNKPEGSNQCSTAAAEKSTSKEENNPAVVQDTESKQSKTNPEPNTCSKDNTSSKKGAQPEPPVTDTESTKSKTDPKPKTCSKDNTSSKKGAQPEPPVTDTESTKSKTDPTPKICSKDNPSSKKGAESEAPLKDPESKQSKTDPEPKTCSKDSPSSKKGAQPEPTINKPESTQSKTDPKPKICSKDNPSNKKGAQPEPSTHETETQPPANKDSQPKTCSKQAQKCTKKGSQEVKVKDTKEL